MPRGQRPTRKSKRLDVIKKWAATYASSRAAAHEKFRGQTITGGAPPKSIGIGMTATQWGESMFSYEHSVISTVNPLGVQQVTLYDPSGTGAMAVGNQSADQSGVQFALQYTFSVPDACNAATKLAMFDQYRIRKCEVEIWYASDVGAANMGAGALPHMFIKQDNDDNNLPANSGYMRNSPDTKLAVLTMNKPYKFTVYPKPAIPTYSGSAFNAYMMGKNTDWQDSQGTSIGVAATQYYGFKAFVQDFPAPAGAAQAFGSQLRVFVKYFIEWRGVVG